MKKWLTRFSAPLIALLLGSSLALAFAPYDIFPLAVVAPAGLFALWLNASAKKAFWLGLIFGCGFFGVGIYWVFISIHLFGDVPNAMAGLITVALILYMSLFPAAAGYLTNRYFPTNNTSKLVLAFPAIWVITEWVRGWLFTGFPWLLIGYSQTNSPLKGLAPILSVYGVSLALVVTSALIVNAILNFRKSNYRPAYFSLLAVTFIWTFSAALNLITWTQPEGKSLSVSLVQGNIPQSLKWSPGHLQLSIDRYLQLTEPLWGKDKIIIWPEAAIPLPLPEAGKLINDLDSRAKMTGSHLILGIPIQSDNGVDYFNSVVTLGEEQNVYLKRLLVPFGEYVPFANIFSGIFNFMNVPISNLQPGKRDQKPLMVGNVKVLTSICYEIAFPEMIRTRDKTIGFLLTVTNDAWFGKSSAQAQHLQMAAMRAIELMRPVVFVSNDGITAIIGPDGKIDSAAPAHETYVLNGNVQPRSGITPWMLNGMDPLLFILICFLAIAYKAARKAKKVETPSITSSEAITQEK